jgi:hypothetical protein
MQETGATPMNNRRPTSLEVGVAVFFLLFFQIFSSPATAAEKEGVLLENVTYSLTDTAEPGVKKYVMEADFKASKEKVCGVICDYYHLNTFMPKDIQSKVLEGVSNRITLEVVMDLPWPFKDIKSILLVQFDKEKANAHWDLIGGNTKRNDGSIVIEDRGDHSHVKQITYLDIGRYYPDWFIKIYTRTLTYKIMRAIRQRIEMMETPALSEPPAPHGDLNH